MADSVVEAARKHLRALDLAPSASPDDVKRAYRDLAKVWHPDRFADSDVRLKAKAEAKLREINAAYNWLRDHPDALVAARHTTAAVVAIRCPSCSARAELSGLRAPRLHRCAGCRALLRIRIATHGSPRVELVEPPPEPQPSRATDTAREGAPSTSQDAALHEVAHRTPRRLWGFVAAACALMAIVAWHFFSSELAPPSHVRQPRAAVQATPQQAAGREIPAPEPDEATYQWWQGALSANQPRARMAAAPATSAPEDQQDEPTNQPAPTFTIGSTEEEVRAVQGEPSSVAGAAWMYELSSVRFADGRVVGYANASGNLKIHLEPQTDVSPVRTLGYFTRGATEDEVLAVQGTPSSVSGDTWTYGLSFVRFIDRRVAVYENTSGNLNIRQNELGIPQANAGDASPRR